MIIRRFWIDFLEEEAPEAFLNTIRWQDMLFIDLISIYTCKSLYFIQFILKLCINYARIHLIRTELLFRSYFDSRELSKDKPIR